MKRFFILFLAVFLLAGCGKTAVSADQIRENIIDEVVSYHPGTAGSSLKQAAVAANVLRFATQQKLSGNDSKAAFEKAWGETDSEVQGYFRENYGDLSRLITGAFSDYDSVSGVFEDAGAGEIMKTALAQADAEKDWNALHTVIETVLSRS
jgi:hypothetical protein